MASNTSYAGSADDTLTFEKAIGYLVISVSTSTTFSFSVDRGVTFVDVPAGLHGIRIGPIKEVRVQADGNWQLIGVQA